MDLELPASTTPSGGVSWVSTEVTADIEPGLSQPTTTIAIT